MSLVASYAFWRAMEDPQNLIDIHKMLRQGRGRRTRELTLNRAVVLFTVAAWQAFVQDLAESLLAAMKPKSDHYTVARDQLVAEAQFQRIKSFVTGELDRFGSPNAENTRRVLRSAGFDPRPYWRWQAGPREWTPADVEGTMNKWLKIRHAIAHGGDLPDTGLLPRVRNGSVSIRRVDAESCMRFFRSLEKCTVAGAQKELREF